MTLVGASEGAKTSIVVGATVTPPVQAVVSLSAEDTLQGVPVAPYAAKLKVRRCCSPLRRMRTA